MTLLVSSLSFSAFAQKKDLSNPKHIQFKEVFTTASIEDDVQIILTNGASDKITVDGDVSAYVSDGQLYIRAKNPYLAAGTKAFIPADFLARVYMNGNGSLSSASLLRNQKVKIYLASELNVFWIW